MIRGILKVLDCGLTMVFGLLLVLGASVGVFGHFQLQGLKDDFLSEAISDFNGGECESAIRYAIPLAWIESRPAIHILLVCYSLRLEDKGARREFEYWLPRRGESSSMAAKMKVVDTLLNFGNNEAIKAARILLSEEAARGSNVAKDRLEKLGVPPDSIE